MSAEEDINRLTRAIEGLGLIMAALDDATAALATAVSVNTTATNNLISALATAAPTADQIAAITAQTTAVAANTTAIDNALNPAAPETPAEPAS